MKVPCVRVAREDGERTREALAERDLLDHDHEITVAEGWLYAPIVDPDAIPEEYTIEERDVPDRETQTMPADLLGFDPSYERLGDIVLLREDDTERARQVANAVMDSSIPTKTVLNRASKVEGEFRTREWDVLAGESTETVHREYGYAFALDVATVYFSPRLATERHRVVQQAAADERIVDMFAGVGPFAIPFAGRGAAVIAVDRNPVAIEYLRENVRRNDVDERVEAIEGDVREVATEIEDGVDRLVMNLPHSADQFLDTAIDLAGEDCVLHYYDIQHENDPYGPGERAIRAAAEEYEVTVETRHTVRSYAPHELNVCLDVRLRA
ncbi:MULTISPECIES: class I SAM-dependent methyltransferase [Halococcus]|uniref:Methyltransferase n=1 Tax=Halococcus salifodinae DSM 8989 TaxID=1227456 RepID=M0N423_9EURY|nr:MULTISPECIES: class I SAM-dependent methyltransferase family protein [Halococcus]EMA52687.1 methyltransferase [Halococcus salifodinae DSM 8989]